MDDILAAELLRRIISAENRIAALEKSHTSEPPVVTSSEKELTPQVGSQRKRVDTRQRAIMELSSQLAEAGTGIKIEGHANRGQTPGALLRAVAPDGSEHRIHLAASGNHWDSTTAFSAWQSIPLGIIHDSNIKAFVLSAEDERNVVRFFCFTQESMLQIANDKLTELPDASKTDATLVHFYPTGSGGMGSGFTDQRAKDPRDLDPYFNNWGALIGAAH